MSGEISDLFEVERLLGFRSCDNHECREFFTEGYLMEDPSETFCSRKCAEKNYPDIVEKDYGTDIIFWTDWED